MTPRRTTPTLTLAAPGAPAASTPTRDHRSTRRRRPCPAITASNPDGAYKAGDVVHVQISFSEQVTVTGTPTLALSNGGTADLRLGLRHLDAHVRLHGSGGRHGVTTSTAASTSALERRHDPRRRDQRRDAHARYRPGHDRRLGNAKNIRIDTTDPTESIAAPASNGTTYNASSLPARHRRLVGGHRRLRRRQTSRSPSRTAPATTGTARRSAPARSSYNATGGTTGAWTYSTSTLVGQLADSHTYTITARATDAAGNQSTTTRTFVFDVAIPTVTNVTASNIDGAYTAGDTIHVEIAFNKTVTVTGTPKLTLNTTPSRTADFSSGSGTPTLTFDYVVQAGDNAATLDYAAAGSLDGERRHDPRRGN